MKRLAITGFSRSGTTALTDLLNIDPRIKITYEKRSFISNNPNRRRKWDDRNAVLELMKKDPIYTGDKCTRPYLKSFKQLQENTDKIIFCLRDPRDIFRSKYWKLIKEDPVEMYIKLMENVLMQDLSRVLFIWYEHAVLNPKYTIKIISNYLELDYPLDSFGHNYKPVRRFGWKDKPKIIYPDMIYNIMEKFGYESTSLW